MADFGFTPELVSSGNIFPFRFVTLDTAAEFTGLQTANATSYTVGVTDGSLYQATTLNATGYHAIAGTTISLQPTNTVQVELGTGGATVGA